MVLLMVLKGSAKEISLILIVWLKCIKKETEIIVHFCKLLSYCSLIAWEKCTLWKRGWLKMAIYYFFLLKLWCICRKCLHKVGEWLNIFQPLHVNVVCYHIMHVCQVEWPYDSQWAFWHWGDHNGLYIMPDDILKTCWCIVKSPQLKMNSSISLILLLWSLKSNWHKKVLSNHSQIMNN